MECRLLITFLVVCMVKACYGGILFSSLPRTLLITASPSQGPVLEAGEDKITLTWRLNRSYEGKDGLYKKVKVALCYAPVSQRDRGWRKTADDLSKDKTCQFAIVNEAYDSSMDNQSIEWRISEDVPTGTYFMRIYAYDSAGKEVGFGQTTDAEKSSNLFLIKGLAGTNLPLQIASACFSVFSVASALGFLLVDKRKRNSSARK